MKTGTNYYIKKYISLRAPQNSFSPIVKWGFLSGVKTEAHETIYRLRVGINNNNSFWISYTISFVLFELTWKLPLFVRHRSVCHQWRRWFWWGRARSFEYRCCGHFFQKSIQLFQWQCIVQCFKGPNRRNCTESFKNWKLFYLFFFHKSIKILII